MVTVIVDIYYHGSVWAYIAGLRAESAKGCHGNTTQVKSRIMFSANLLHDWQCAVPFCMICSLDTVTGLPWTKQTRALYCTSTGAKVTVIFSTRELHPWYHLPDEHETEQWGTSTRPEQRETDLYLVHELCWQRLWGHVGPGEFHLGCLYEALERLPPRIGNTIDCSTPLWRGGLDVRRPEYQNDLAPNDDFGVSSLEELMRFARDPSKPLKPLPEEIVYPSQPPTDCFRVLPLRVLE
ncbi:hypothetical protein BDV30DRAFT_235821 [Aspergillus minisclerotigenes]|uniref:Uncharacterized protein n=1 Tax=Aspergillus minisclerotigenes TaxID=656917 RepID=A0A5N6JCH9_9EURO|nr:hypothetical protein BDV30DRAFT_235821 [Aspergillus minisclerotigenes]